MKYQEIIETENTLAFIKETFVSALKYSLSLHTVSAPIAILDGTGINDDLNSIERPVSFPIKALSERQAVVVHSLAKWKRKRLKELNMENGTGIVTDMRALRPDEDYSPLHSVYVDQWDWERAMRHNSRNISYLKSIVRKIYSALLYTERALFNTDMRWSPVLPPEVTFIHAESLLQEYPEMTPKQREHEIVKKHGAVFIMGIGGKLSDGKQHDTRAADYDDWSTEGEDNHKGLNGDLLLWHDKLQCALEVSSMGIRVDRTALLKQLELTGQMEKAKLPFHQLLLDGQLPDSIGGGIGQSRICMFLMKKVHIGEVQVGIWSDEKRQELEHSEVYLL